jgi:hypothetical protein
VRRGGGRVGQYTTGKTRTIIEAGAERKNRNELTGSYRVRAVICGTISRAKQSRGISRLKVTVTGTGKRAETRSQAPDISDRDQRLFLPTSLGFGFGGDRGIHQHNGLGLFYDLRSNTYYRVLLFYLQMIHLGSIPTPTVPKYDLSGLRLYPSFVARSPF